MAGDDKCNVMSFDKNGSVYCLHISPYGYSVDHMACGKVIKLKRGNIGSVALFVLINNDRRVCVILINFVCDQELFL